MCKHSNMVLYEPITATTGHSFTDGRYTDSVNQEGGYLNYVEVACLDCDFERRYSRKRLPKWVAGRLKQVTDRLFT